MAVLLALDTSTPRVGVALHDGLSVVHRARSAEPMKHGEQLAPMIEQALAAVGAVRQDLTAVAVGVGPGPFTGLRVGVVTARVLAWGLGIPAYGVSSLDVLAQEAAPLLGRPFVATLDARRRELFWAAYDEQGERLSGPEVGPPASLPPGPVVGAGAGLYPDQVRGVPGPEAPDPGVLAEAVVAEAVPLVDPEPVYLRRPDAQVPGPPKAVS